jgi:uncharacterized LabA/DUF88 family protein
VRAFYYTAISEDQDYVSVRPLVDWLNYNGFTVVTKAGKEFVDSTGRRKMKGNMVVELAVNAMELANHIARWCCFRETAPSAPWCKRCSAEASASP